MKYLIGQLLLIILLANHFGAKLEKIQQSVDASHESTRDVYELLQNR